MICTSAFTSVPRVLHSETYEGNKRPYKALINPCYAQNTPMVKHGTKSIPFAPCASLCAQIRCHLNSKGDLDTPQ